MNPSHIYFKNINIDDDNMFTLNLSKENEIESIIFDKDHQYVITGLKINAELPDKNILKIKNVKEQSRVSGEIQEIIKNYNEPDLTLYMSNPETKAIKIPFVKKSKTDLPRIKFTYFNTLTKKIENFFIYDFIGHLKKFGFDWIDNNLGLRYRIRIKNSDSKKIKEKLTLDKLTRKKTITDEIRVWNMKMNRKKNNSGTDFSRLSYLISYLLDERKMKQFLKISGKKHDFNSMTNKEKNDYLGKLTRATHVHEKIYFGNTNSFYSELHVGSVVLINALTNAILRFTDRLQTLFVPRFYHGRVNTTFLRRLKYVGEKKEIGEQFFSECGTGLGRKLYEYRIAGDISRPIIFKDKDLDWPFPEKFL